MTEPEPQLPPEPLPEAPTAADDPAQTDEPAQTDAPVQGDDAPTEAVALPAIAPAAPPAAALPPSPQPPAAPVAVAARPTQPTAFEAKTGPGLLVRAVWFVFVGWWATGIVSGIAWAAMVTIIGLPLGIWLINRIPTVLTLRPRTQVVYSWTDAQGFARTSVARIEQQPWWIRGLWFVVVGWWASALVMAVGYVLVLLIITLPIGLMIYNRVPFVASLYRY